jgi:hypothetical protein
MKRFIQVVLYLQMAFVGLAAVVGFLAHKFPIAAQEQALGRQVGFILLGSVVTLWIVSRFWQQQPQLLLIPIVFSAVGLIHHGFDAVIVNASLGLPAPTASDIYIPLVSDAVFLTLYLVGYIRVGRSPQGHAASAKPGSVASGVGTSV